MKNKSVKHSKVFNVEIKMTLHEYSYPITALFQIPAGNKKLAILKAKKILMKKFSFRADSASVVLIDKGWTGY